MASAGSPSSSGSSAGTTFSDVLLGIPKGGLKPGSDDAEALHSAETFVNEIRAEMLEYDKANAEAVAASLRKWAFWRRSPVPQTAVGHSASSSLSGGEGGPVDSGKADGRVVFSERTPQFETRQAQQRWFRLRKRTPSTIPLLMRWWVPWVCVGTVALVWTPDTWKLRTLHYADCQYAALRRMVHTQYWRMTMDPREFETLMKEIDAATPKNRRSVKSTDCPF